MIMECYCLCVKVTKGIPITFLLKNGGKKKLILRLRITTLSIL